MAARYRYNISQIQRIIKEVVPHEESSLPVDLYLDLPAVRQLLATDPAAAQKRMTDYCSGLQEKAFGDTKVLLNLVRWTMSEYSNTMKMSRNPETDELLSTERVLDPIRVELDGIFYGQTAE